MTLSFKYKTIRRPDGTGVKSPSIPITFVGDERIDIIALIDSGADISAMSKDIAEMLGLNLNAERHPAYGIGGKVDAVDTSVNIVVEKGHERYNFRIPIKVILGDYDFPVLLGRAGFFDKFIITFNQKEGKVLLKKQSRKF